MAWDALLNTVEQRFRAVVDDLDAVPTIYQNQPLEELDLDGLPEDTGFGLWRAVTWVTGESQELARGREYTNVRMVVMVASNLEVGLGPAIAEAQSIRTKMREDMIENPLEGIHFVGGDVQIIGEVMDPNTKAKSFQVNYSLRVMLEEAVT